MQSYMHLIKQKHMRKDISDNGDQQILKALSFDGIEVEASRHLANLKAIDPMKIFHKTIDYKIYNGNHQIPVRIFLPGEKMEDDLPVFLFFHGGGWVTESIDNYERICARLASATDHIVVSVEYRLAPEYPFPIGFYDCYMAAKAMYTNQFILNTDPNKITLIGDSAGGNLAAAVSLMARDQGEFLPKRQILIYPAVNNDYSEESPYLSVRRYGTEYLLTAGKMRDYINFYASAEEDKKSKYLAPLMETDYSNQPDTLILTAECDPLRDEGEEYGRRLKEAGNKVEVHRIQDALHGFFALGVKYYHVQESFAIINRFLSGYTSDETSRKVSPANEE